MKQVCKPTLFWREPLLAPPGEHPIAWHHSSLHRASACCQLWDATFGYLWRFILIPSGEIITTSLWPHWNYGECKGWPHFGLWIIIVCTDTIYFWWNWGCLQIYDHPGVDDFLWIHLFEMFCKTWGCSRLSGWRIRLQNSISCAGQAQSGLNHDKPSVSKWDQWSYLLSRS